MCAYESLTSEVSFSEILFHTCTYTYQRAAHRNIGRGGGGGGGVENVCCASNYFLGPLSYVFGGEGLPFPNPLCATILKLMIRLVYLAFLTTMEDIIQARTEGLVPSNAGCHTARNADGGMKFDTWHLTAIKLSTHHFFPGSIITLL